MDKDKQTIGGILESLPGEMVLVTLDGTVLAQKSAASRSVYTVWPTVPLFGGTEKACRLHWLTPEGSDPALTAIPLELLLGDLVASGPGYWFRRLLTEKADFLDFSSLAPVARESMPCRLGALKIGRGTGEEAVEALRDLLPDMKTYQLGPGFVVLKLPCSQELSRDWSESVLTLLEEELMMDPLLILGETVEALDMLQLHCRALENIGERLYSRGVRGMRYLLAHLPELTAGRLIDDPFPLITDLGRVIEPVLKDADLTQTAEVFIQTNLNIAETAQHLFLHRNTLVYRLNKIERLTGLDLKRLDQAMAYVMLKSARKTD